MKLKLALGCWAVLAVSTLVFAQDAKKPATVASELNSLITGVEHDVVPAAEAMPEDKYSFAPTNGEFKGVRTFAAQLKHIAAVNYMLAGAVLGEKPPVDTGGEDGPAGVESKADVVKFLKDSFAYAHKAVDTVTAANQVEPIKSPFGDGNTTRLTMASFVFAHSFDHYGQVAVYLRMNGIIPPASRQQ